MHHRTNFVRIFLPVGTRPMNLTRSIALYLLKEVKSSTLTKWKNSFWALIWTGITKSTAPTSTFSLMLPSIWPLAVIALQFSQVIRLEVTCLLTFSRRWRGSLSAQTHTSTTQWTRRLPKGSLVNRILVRMDGSGLLRQTIRLTAETRYFRLRKWSLLQGTQVN